MPAQRTFSRLAAAARRRAQSAETPRFPTVHAKVDEKGTEMAPASSSTHQPATLAPTLQSSHHGKAPGATKASKHHCHAIGCEKAVPPKMLMCLWHWRQVPRPLQAAVWALYVPGQERRKDPTAEYLDAAKDAICAVAEAEGVPIPKVYRRRSWMDAEEARAGQ